MKPYSGWLVFSLFNLSVVALFGVVMRYKIGFEFPLFQQKYLLHGHSHFAFAGWITQTLMVLMVLRLTKLIPELRKTNFNYLIAANCITAYGMLISLSAQGYGIAGITFSLLSIFVFYYFAWKFSRLLKQNKAIVPENNWYRAALFFGVISTFGTFVLAWMMSTHHFDQHLYLGSLYYFLHFQYNGWFFFACMGLLWGKICDVYPDFSNYRNVYRMFAISCIPAYFLSTLWLHFPAWVLWLIVFFAAMQLAGWLRFLQLIRMFFSTIMSGINKTAKLLLLFVAITTSIKLLLQLFSTIPAMSKLAFGFRPIVIAYLHLILLAVISVFLLTWLYESGLIKKTRLFLTALVIFIIGVFLNELALMIQGIASFAYFPIPHINEILFYIALILFTGTILMFASQFKKEAVE